MSKNTGHPQVKCIGEKSLCYAVVGGVVLEGVASCSVGGAGLGVVRGRARSGGHFTRLESERDLSVGVREGAARGAACAHARAPRPTPRAATLATCRGEHHAHGLRSRERSTVESFRRNIGRLKM